MTKGRYQLFDIAGNKLLPMRYRTPESAAKAAVELHRLAIKQYGNTSPLGLYEDGGQPSAEAALRFTEAVIKGTGA